MKKQDQTPWERGNLSVTLPTRFEFNELRSRVSRAMGRHINVDEMVRMMISNYAATAPELHIGKVPNGITVAADGSLRLENA